VNVPEIKFVIPACRVCGAPVATATFDRIAKPVEGSYRLEEERGFEWHTCENGHRVCIHPSEPLEIIVPRVSWWRRFLDELMGVRRWL
jgi:hypothetical protein